MSEDRKVVRQITRNAVEAGWGLLEQNDLYTLSPPPNSPTERVWIVRLPNHWVVSIHNGCWAGRRMATLADAIRSSLQSTEDIMIRRFVADAFGVPSTTMEEAAAAPAAPVEPPPPWDELDPGIVEPDYWSCVLSPIEDQTRFTTMAELAKGGEYMVMTGSVNDPLVERRPTGWVVDIRREGDMIYISHTSEQMEMIRCANAWGVSMKRPDLFGETTIRDENHGIRLTQTGNRWKAAHFHVATNDHAHLSRSSPLKALIDLAMQSPR